MEKKTGKRIMIAAAVFAALIAVFAAVYFLAVNPPASGAKEITVEIVHSDKTQKTIEIKTDAEFLRKALEEKNLIKGTESSYGLYVITVDGETADDTKQQWWCFTQGGQPLSTGVDSTPIKNGDKFEITFKTGW